MNVVWWNWHEWNGIENDLEKEYMNTRKLPNYSTSGCRIYSETPLSGIFFLVWSNDRCRGRTISTVNNPHHTFLIIICMFKLQSSFRSNCNIFFYGWTQFIDKLFTSCLSKIMLTTDKEYVLSEKIRKSYIFLKEVKTWIQIKT